MREYRGVIVGLVVGIIMGFVGGPAWIILPWGAIAVSLAYDSKKYKILSSAVFGFTATFVFMLKGYDGAASLISRVPPFLLIGAFGGVCGLIAGWIGTKIGKAKD